MRISDIKNRITKRDKIAFLSAFIFFFLVHVFKITNYLPNHDALTSFYSNQNIVESGRWFLSIACLPSTYFDLPWLVGVLSAIYLALTAVIVVRIFDLSSKVSIVIASALLVSFPAVTETMLFEFTADGYFLAMLLAALAIRLVTTTNQKWYMYIAAGVLLCLSCGIYQAYFCFAVVLALVYLMLEILKQSKTTKQHLIWCGKQIIMYGVTLGAYYIIWKSLMNVQNISAIDYQGITEAGNFGISSLISAAIGMVTSVMNFAFGRNFYKGNLTFYAVLGALFFLALLCVLFLSIKKKKLMKSKGSFVLFAAALLAVPVATYFWLFVSSGTAYGTRMLQSLALLYILPLALSEKYLDTKWRNISALTLCLLIAAFSCQANIAYLYLNQCYESTYHTSTEVLQRVHLASETGEEKIAIVGNYVYDTEMNNNPLSKEMGSLSGTIKSTLAYDHTHIKHFTKNTFFNEFDFVSYEELEEIKQYKEIEDMPCWPAKDSVKNINGYIVVKLAEPATETPAEN